VNAYKLTDTFLSESDGGKQLLANLEMQVWGYKEWQKELDTIRKKFEKQNLNKTLLNELIEMGPEATATLRALNQLSTDELTQYSRLYTQKLGIAKSEAKKQNEQLRKDTDKQIADLRKAANAEIAKAKKEAVSAIKTIQEPMTSEMQKLAKQAASWGTDVITSFVRGMKTKANKKGTFEQVSKAIASQLKSSGLASPSGKSSAGAKYGSSSSGSAKKPSSGSGAKKTEKKQPTRLLTLLGSVNPSSFQGGSGYKLTETQLKGSGLTKPGASVNIGGQTGHVAKIGSAYSVYWNTPGKKGVVKQLNFATGAVKTYAYNKKKYKQLAAKAKNPYGYMEFADVLRQRGVKGYASGGMVNQLVKMEYGRDQGLIPAQLGEVVLAKQFAQNMIPRFTLAVERVTNALESVPTPAPLNRITAPSSQTAVTGGRDLGQMAGLMAQMAVLLKQYLPDIADRDVVLDTGAMVGELSPRISEDWAGIRRRSR
jgi:hypothetical protein